MIATTDRIRSESGSRTVADGPGGGPELPAVGVLRQLIQGERRRMSGPARHRAARGIRDVFLELTPVRSARCVALYVSGPDEPGTGVLRTALARRGVSVLLPVRVGGNTLLWISDPAVQPVVLAEQPQARPVTQAQVILVPAMAVDTAGNWLGRGRDYDDDVLHRLHPGTLLAAAVHDAELFDAAVEPVPAAPRHARVQLAITPSRAMLLAGGPEP